MTDLLSRLSAATGPSRELDAEIALANGWTRGRKHPNANTDPWIGPKGQIRYNPPRYTESIDGVRRDLLPENTKWQVGCFIGGFIAEIWMENKSYTVSHPTSPATALVIACLKAKEDSKP